ncbi:DUF6893 family small protein [Sphaerisporangium fuscum]
MLKRLITLGILVAVGVMIYQSIPELRKYMLIRKM